MSRVAIDLEADIQPVSEFRANAAAMIEQVRSTGRPVVLTQRWRSAAVLLDVRTYEGMLDELELPRDIHRANADVEAGRVVPHEAARARVLDRYR